MQTNINMNRYVSINSGLASGQSVKTRELIGNFVTTNPELPTKSMITFTTDTEVGNYFGFESSEYDYAINYFGYVSKSVTKPGKIMFSSYSPSDTNAIAMGGKLSASDLTLIKAVTAGGFTITHAGTSGTIADVDHSGDSDFASVASTLQTKIQALGDGFSTATVTFNAARSRIEITVVGVGSLTLTASVGNELSVLGFEALDSKISNGISAQSPVEAMSLMIQESDNFGSFLFIDGLSIENHVSVAKWNKAQNVMFIYHVSAIEANSVDWSAALVDIGGTCITFNAIPSENKCTLAMAAQAAINYNRINATINFMFIVDGNYTADVTDDTTATQLDKLRINYYGRTQKGGVPYSFYQRGILCGTGNDITSMSEYSNEQWLKSYAQSKHMELLLSSEISADDDGRGKLMGMMLDDGSVISLAKKNGTISIGKNLNQTQKIKVQEMTGDPLAYLQIESTGFWYNVEFIEFVNDSGATENKASYTLIYAKKNVVNKIEGTHALL
jgi:hypothetical protein